MSRKLTLKIELTAWNKMLHHVYEVPTLECGGYLIGSISTIDENSNELIGHINDVYIAEGCGTQSEFTFTSESGLHAYGYCLKKYSADDKPKKILSETIIPTEVFKHFFLLLTLK